MQIAWYNKSRRWARICPVCKRLYRVDDTPLGDGGDLESGKRDSEPPKRLREQEISGICTFTSKFITPDYRVYS